jgi:hypothetical protein
VLQESQNDCGGIRIVDMLRAQPESNLVNPVNPVNPTLQD